MIKLSASREKFILEIFTVFVVFAFLATPMLPSIGHSGTGANTKPIYGVNSNPFVSNNNNPSSAGYVKYTLVLSNNTLFNGNMPNISNGNVSVGPTYLVYDPSNGYVYLTDSVNDSVMVINPEINHVIKNIAVGSEPKGITLDPKTNELYVMNQGSNSISIINGTTNTVLKTISTCLDGPRVAAFDPNNDYLYVANYGTYGVTVYDTTNNSYINFIPTTVDFPSAIYYDPSNNQLYVGSGNIEVINATSYKELTTINTVSISATKMIAIIGVSESYIYALNQNMQGSVIVINPNNNEAIGSITVGIKPYGISYDPSNGFIYVSNEGSNDVSIINTSSMSVLYSLEVSGSPKGLTYVPASQYVYVADYSSDSVSIISSSIITHRSHSYSVYFTETGLPSGTMWGVDINNENEITTTQKSLFMVEPNGTYKYSILLTQHSYFAIDKNGIFNVNGSLLSIEVTFYSYIGGVNKTLFLNNNTLIDGNSNISNIGIYPQSVVYDNLTGTVLITGGGSNSVIFVNATTEHIIGSVGVGAGPVSSALDPLNGLLYVVDLYSGQLSIVNPESMRLVGEVNLSSHSGEDGPDSIVFSSSLNELFVANSYTNTLQIINPDTFAVIKNISVGEYPDSLAYDYENDYVYVGNGNSNNVTVFDALNDTIIGNVNTTGAGPWRLYYDSETDYVYVFDLNAVPNLIVINTTTNQIVQRFSIEENVVNSMIQNSQNGILYLAGGNSVIALNSTSGGYLGSISVGDYANYMAFGENDNILYLSNDYSSSLSIISIPGYYDLGNGYNLTFQETGLPQGEVWKVSLTNVNESFVGSSSTDTLSLIVPNGVYNLSVISMNGTYKAITPSFINIDGSNLTENVAFYNNEYSVLFTESGLPSKTTWYVNLSNGQYFSSSASTISFSEPNGTYSYTIATTSKIYSPTPASGSFMVNGSAVSESITFSEVKYTITLTESGLPSGTSWSVTFNGTKESSTTNTITFSVPNGTYSYTIGSVTRHTSSPPSGSVTVNDKNVTVSITFTVTKKSSSPSGISSTELYGIIGAVVAVAVIGSVLAITRKKR